MTKKFLEKLLYCGSVDTKKYRYVLRGNVIKRLPLEYLDTTTALNGWTIVKVI